MKYVGNKTTHVMDIDYPFMAKLTDVKLGGTSINKLIFIGLNGDNILHGFIKFDSTDRWITAFKGFEFIAKYDYELWELEEHEVENLLISQI
jgi:hypothetical protein